jgi:hypothetical protein
MKGEGPWVSLRAVPNRSTTVLMMVQAGQFARSDTGPGRIYDTRGAHSGHAYTPPRWVRDLIHEFIGQGLVVDNMRRPFRIEGTDTTRYLTVLALSLTGEAEAYLRWNNDLDQRLKEAKTDE